MRAVLQRVSQAQVDIAGETVGSITRGWLVLLGVGSGDSLADVRYLADKIVHLRAFTEATSEDGGGAKMQRSVLDINGQLLVVSQFTLFGDCRKGRRPGFTQAAPPDQAKALYEAFIEATQESGLVVATGRFQAAMQVSLVNDGPVTFLLDSKHLRSEDV